jgi:prepilin-type N-terminal cleavage/methylation domain-containing protein
MIKKSGFTLIELIVSVAIMVMVTGIFLANYNSANRRTDLTMTAQKMVTDIRLAQNYALGLARYGGSGSLNVPFGGWGVHFDLQTYGTNKYVVFADDNGNKVYDSGEDNLQYGAQVTTLPTNIIINSITLGGVSSNKADITFLPPDPITTIMGQSATSSSATIVLKDTKTNTVKTVRINFLGLAEVID